MSSWTIKVSHVIQFILKKKGIAEQTSDVFAAFCNHARLFFSDALYGAADKHIFLAASVVRLRCKYIRVQRIKSIFVSLPFSIFFPFFFFFSTIYLLFSSSSSISVRFTHTSFAQLSILFPCIFLWPVQYIRRAVRTVTHIYMSYTVILETFCYFSLISTPMKLSKVK